MITKAKPILIIAPCFNENITVLKFLDELEKALSVLQQQFKVVIVDDSSTDDTLALLKGYQCQSPNIELSIISLLYNVGHQGAIYQGLLYAQNAGTDHVIVMDADGEDDPAAISELIRYQDKDIDIVNVVRGKRQEAFLFRILYKLYKLLFYSITGKTMKFGNYCMINRKIISSTVETSFIHFAAHLSKQKAKIAEIIFDRQKRLDGKSKMNINGLIHHAFKSFVEYAESLLLVFLKIFIATVIVISGLVLYILYQKIFTSNAILGWASTLSAILISIAIICLGFFVIGILLLNIMNKKDNKHKVSIYTLID